MIWQNFPPLSLDGEGENGKIETLIFIVEKFSKFPCFQWQQQRNEFVLSYIEWNLDLRISPAGTKSAASAFSLLRYVHYEPQSPRQIGFLLHSSFGISAVKIRDGWRPALDYFPYFVPEMLQWWPIIGIRRPIIIISWNIQYCGARKSVVGKSRDWLMSVIACGRLKNGCKEAKSCETSRRCEPESRLDKCKVEN